MRKWIQITFAVLCFCTYLTAQVKAQSNYPVTIHVQVIPPYSAHFSEYANKAIVSITNQSQNGLDIFLKGRFENDQGQFIQTKEGIYTQVPIHVPAMQTVVMQASQIDGSYLSRQNIETNMDDSYAQKLLRLDLIPEGYYTFCLYAFIRTSTDQYIPVSDPNGMSSCAVFNVGYVLPPQIITPVEDENVLTSPNQNVQISWAPPVGNIQGASIVYDLFMVQVLPDQDPYVVLSNAVEYNAGIFFKQSNIPITVFQFTRFASNFQLYEGSDYALLVQVRDLTGQTVFQNNGKSEIRVFRYGFDENQIIPVSGTIPSGNGAACSCVVDVASLNQTNSNSSLQPGGSFTMATLQVNIGTVQQNGNTVSGDGTISMNGVPVQILFDNVVVNQNGIAIAGKAQAKTADGFSFIHNGGDLPSISTADYTLFTDRITEYNLDAVVNGIGLTLPFGLNSVGAPDAVNAAIVNLNITPLQASYNAVAVIQLADANNVLSLAALNVCFNNTTVMCGDALFVLTEDFEVPVIQLTFNKYTSAAEPGTFVRYANGELQTFHINADYNFPASLVTRPDGSPAKAILDASASSWSDWTATVTMDPFITPALSTLVFSLDQNAFYDHSTIQNPTGMPAGFNDPDLMEKNSQIQNPLWTGFYLPVINASLPAIVQDTHNPDNKLIIGATDLILDDQGITGVVGAQNVVSVGDGSLGGWYCSVDDISVKLLNSSFKAGGLYGRLIMPFSDKEQQQSQINYSCTLTSENTDGNFSYQFVAQQQNDIDFSAWWAHINLNNCSISVTGDASGNIVAAAALSGNLSLEDEIQGYKIGIDLVEVQNLVVRTAQPYVHVDHVVARFTSPQHFFGGFPIGITSIVPTITDNSAGLKFNFSLTLSDIGNHILPVATSDITVAANLLGGSRPLWQKTDLQLNEICMQGDLAGVIHIKEGCIDFFKDDPVFGNGISGNLDASFTGLDDVSVQCQVKFGEKNFNYWYFDAFGAIPAIPVAPGLSINGLGGGVWYNLTKTAGNENISAKDYFQNRSTYQLGAYVPQSGSGGFKVKVGVCTSDGGYIAQGTGEMGMTFNASGGFGLNLDGTLYLEILRASAGLGIDPNAPIRGIINWHIGIADQVFNIYGRLELRYPVAGPELVKGSGWFDLLSDVKNQNYYLKLGEPIADKRIELSIADLLDFNAYFMAGNHINGAIPDPDPAIVNVARIPEYERISFDPAEGGMVLGATMKFHQQINFLVFYLNVAAGVGADVSLTRYPRGCGDNPNPPGLNGWYAIGQVYAGFTGSMGMHVDLWFFEGNVEAAKIDASLLLNGGLPDPYWFNGYANLSFDALDHMVQGSVNFNISIGDKCVPELQTFTMPLIAEIKPGDNTADIPLNASPEVTFNYPAEKDFELVVQNEDGEKQPRTYRLKIQNFNIMNQDDGRVFANYNNPESYPLFIDDQNKDLILDPDVALKPQTHYQLDVSVKAQEKVGSEWKDCQYHEEPVMEEKSSSFKTGDCKLDQYIADPSSRLASFPFPNQRYFLQGESNKGAIVLDNAYECASHPDEKYDLLVRFTPVKEHQELSSMEVPIQLNGSKYLTYTIPTLPNSSIVRVEVIKRRKLTKNDSYKVSQFLNTSATQINRALSNPAGNVLMNNNLYNSIFSSPAGQGGGEVSVESGNLDPSNLGSSVHLTSFKKDPSLHLTDKTVDVILYSYHFRTSEYNTLKEKVDGDFFNSVLSYGQLKGSPQVEIKAKEKFDLFDATGFKSSNYHGGSLFYFTVPLISFQEAEPYNSWLSNYALPCVYKPAVDAGINIMYLRTRGGTNYTTVQYLGLECDTQPYCVPLRPIDIGSYDPPLSKAEIDAAEPVILNGVNLSGMTLSQSVNARSFGNLLLIH